MYVMVDNAVQIKDMVKIMEHTNVVGKSLIEDGVFIGPSVTMANDPLLGARGYGQHIKGVTIRRSAAISAGAVLLPGIEIGERAVVAAGAIVDKAVPADRMAAGAPVKTYRKVPPSWSVKLHEGRDNPQRRS